MSASEPDTSASVTADSEGADSLRPAPRAESTFPALDELNGALPAISASTQTGPSLTRSQSAPVLESDTSSGAPTSPARAQDPAPAPAPAPGPAPTAAGEVMYDTPVEQVPWTGSALGLQQVGLPVPLGVAMAFGEDQSVGVYGGGAAPAQTWPMGIVEGQRRKGACKFFNATKGFGFIVDDQPEMAGIEVFVHYTAIDAVQAGPEGFRALADGEKVDYTITQGPKGWQAQNVTGPNGAPCIGPPPRSNQHFSSNWGHPQGPGARGPPNHPIHQADDRQKGRRQSVGGQSAQGPQNAPGGGGPKAYQRRSRNDSGFWSAGMASPTGSGMSPGGYQNSGPFAFSPGGMPSNFSSPIGFQSFPGSPSAFGPVPLGIAPPWAQGVPGPGLGFVPAPADRPPNAQDQHNLPPRPASAAQEQLPNNPGSFQWSQGIAPGAVPVTAAGWIPPPPPPPGWDPDLYHQQLGMFIPPPVTNVPYGYPTLAVDPAKFAPAGGMVQPWVGPDEQQMGATQQAIEAGGEQQ